VYKQEVLAWARTQWYTRDVITGLSLYSRFCGCSRFCGPYCRKSNGFRGSTRRSRKLAAANPTSRVSKYFGEEERLFPMLS
jgi:hypothetical protein